MPVFTSLKESKRKTRNRQRFLYGYSTDSNAMLYLDGSGSLLDTEVPNDIVKAAIDFNQADNYSTTADSGIYNGAPLITNMSMNGSMGNMITFNFSFLVKIIEAYITTSVPSDLIVEPITPPIDYGTTRYFCQGDGEPEQFSWNISTSVVNSGCVDSGTSTAKVKVNSFNAAFTQYFTSAFPIGNTYTAEDGVTSVDVDYCTSELFLPPYVGDGTGGDDSKPLLALWDFSVSEKGTEYNTDHSDGWKFIAAECDGIPEIPTDWVDFPVI
jgi:hypothetical protein